MSSREVTSRNDLGMPPGRIDRAREYPEFHEDRAFRKRQYREKERELGWFFFPIGEERHDVSREFLLWSEGRVCVIDMRLGREKEKHFYGNSCDALSWGTIMLIFLHLRFLLVFILTFEMVIAKGVAKTIKM